MQTEAGFYTFSNRSCVYLHSVETIVLFLEIFSHKYPPQFLVTKNYELFNMKLLQTSHLFPPEVLWVPH